MSGTIWCQADSANSWHAPRAERGWPWALICKQAICCHAAAASKCRPRVLHCCPAASKNRSRFESLIGDKVWFSPSGPTVHSAPTSNAHFLSPAAIKDHNAGRHLAQKATFAIGVLVWLLWTADQWNVDNSSQKKTLKWLTSMWRGPENGILKLP